MPEDWRIGTISTFCIGTKSGSTPNRSNQDYWQNGSIPWLKSGEVHNNITTVTEECITKIGLSESSTKLLPIDTVLMAMYGVTAGEVGYLAIEATTNQAICGMICRDICDAAFLFFTLLSNQRSISRQSTGGAQSNLSKEYIDNINIVIPDKETIDSLGLAPIIAEMKVTNEIYHLYSLQSVLLSQLSSR